MKSLVIILLALGVIGVIANPVPKQITSDNKNPLPSENIESQTKHEESTNNGNEQKKEHTIDTSKLTFSNDRKCDDKVDIIIEETVTSAVDDTSNLVDDIPIEGDLIITDAAPSQIDAGQIPIDETSSLIDAAQIPIDETPSLIDAAQITIDETQSLIDTAQIPINETPNLIDAAQIPINETPSLIDAAQIPINETPSLIDAAQIPIDETSSLIDAIHLPQLPNDEFGDDFLGSDISIKGGPLNRIQDEIMQTAAGFVPTPLVFRRKQKPRRRFANRRHFRPNPFRRKFNFYYPYYGFYHPSSLRFY